MASVAQPYLWVSHDPLQQQHRATTSQGSSEIVPHSDGHGFLCCNKSMAAILCILCCGGEIECSSPSANLFSQPATLPHNEYTFQVSCYQNRWAFNAHAKAPNTHETLGVPCNKRHDMLLALPGHNRPPKSVGPTPSCAHLFWRLCRRHHANCSFQPSHQFWLATPC